MHAQSYKDILKSEPVQWAVDYLSEIIGILREGNLDQSYALALLELEREELLLLHRRLQPPDPPEGSPVIFHEGLSGARLLVIRQLLALFPKPGTCRHHDRQAVLSAIISRLQAEKEFFSRFKLSLEHAAPSKELVQQALCILSSHRLLERVSLPGRRLQLYCIGYTLPHPAYYLYRTHSIVCGASPLEPGEKLRCLLHEFGHAVLAVVTAGRPVDRESGERFARRFSAVLLAGQKAPIPSPAPAKL